MTEFDVVIIGGGMVGASAAIGLARQKYKVALVESIAPKPFQSDQKMDLRISAISPSSIDLLCSLKAWPAIKNKRICPYARLETWEQEDCRTRFDAKDLGLNYLGYMVENRILQLGLWEQFEALESLTVFSHHQLEQIKWNTQDDPCHLKTNKKHQHLIVLDNGEALKAPWVIGADGANSKVRTQAKIGVSAWDYRQTCMLIHVQTEKPQQDITWQWFTPQGPRSFLPFLHNQACLVWYDSPQRIRHLQSLSLTQLRLEIIENFPKELGDIDVIQAGSFALTRRHAQTYVTQGCVLIGDAAHTINPLAGQGVNLGFKDVWALLEAVADKGLTLEAMKKYESMRRKDNLLMQTSMDVFYQAFSNDVLPVKFARNLGLKLAEHAGGIKKQVLKYALGLS